MNKPRAFPPSYSDHAKPWKIPFVEPSVSAQDEDKTNLLNRREDWVYEPPEEVEEILPPTADEIEAIRQAAYDEGFHQGREEGHKQGYEEGLAMGKEQGYNEGYVNGEQAGMDTGRTNVQTLTQQWQALLDHIHAPVEKVNDATREQLTLLAVSLARAVVMCEIKTNQDVIMQALAEGMKALPINEQEYHVHLHPDDVTLVQTSMDAEQLQQRRWQLIAAPGIERGGCDIVTPNNAVDVTIERRLRQVLDAFLANQGIEDA